VAARTAPIIAEVSEQNGAKVQEPRALVTSITVARMAEVSDQYIASVKEAPAVTARVAVASIADVPGQNVASLHAPSALGAPIASPQTGELSAQNVAVTQEPQALVVRISEHSITPMRAPTALLAPMSKCAQIWDQMTHMTREEWADACRRVDDEKQAGDR
jgi:hypothetical protein